MFGSTENSACTINCYRKHLNWKDLICYYVKWNETFCCFINCKGIAIIIKNESRSIWEYQSTACIHSVNLFIYETLSEILFSPNSHSFYTSKEILYRMILSQFYDFNVTWILLKVPVWLRSILSVSDTHLSRVPVETQGNHTHLFS